MNRFGEPDAIELGQMDRIAALERRLGRTRRVLAWLWAGLAILGAHAAWPSPRTQVAFESDRLVVKDASGNVRVTLGMDTPAAAGLALFDKNGRALVRLDTSRRAGEVFLDSYLDRPNAEPRASLSAGEPTSLVLRSATAELWRLEAGLGAALRAAYPDGELAFLFHTFETRTIYTYPRNPLSTH